MRNTHYRTVRVKLDVPSDREADLHRTKEQFLDCANRTSEWAWRDDEHCVTDKIEAQHALYDELKAETDLTANVVQKAIRRAIEAVKAGVGQLQNGTKTSQPEFTAWSIVYDTKSATFNDDHVTLATVNGRVACEYVLPYEDERDATPHGKYFEHEAYAPKRATLQYETADEAFYLYVMLARDADDGERQEAGQRDESPENGTVLGVDLNATGAFAVTSSGAYIGSADQLTHERQQYERRRGRLQQTGTRSAHLTIQSLGGRFARRSTERLHCWANELLIEAERVGADGIILEELTHIRERIGNGEQFQRWAFAAFIEIVEYKAEASGLFVVAVDPAYTSQRCSKCGHTHEYNRDGSRFSCRDCGYTANADYNAAKNVGLRYCRRIQRGQTSRAGWATCQLALKSGTLNVNGEYTPSSSEEAERESTDKSVRRPEER